MSLSKRFFGVGLWGLLTIVTAYSQGFKSPYTSLGLGDVIQPATVINRSMGGYGLTSTNGLNINSLNPSLLPFSYLTTFDFGLVGERRTSSLNGNSSSNLSGNLAYLNIIFPFKQGKWTTGLSLNPYSVSNYGFDFITFQDSTGAAIINEVEGTGGINEAALSSGYRIAKNIFVGGKASFIFGTQDRTSAVTIDDRDFPPSFRITESQETSIQDFKFSLAGSYIRPFKNRRDSIRANYLKLGINYEFKANLNAENTTFIERTALSSGVTLVEDTLNNSDGTVTIPGRLGIGLSYERGGVWNVGVDVYMQNWSDYRNFFGGNENLQPTYKVIVGGYWNPDFSSIRSYFERITYRAGVSYERTPYLVSETNVDDFGINFGFSLPVGNSRLSLGSLNLGFRYGQRGKNEPDIIKETYYRLFLGFTFNSQWFIQRKFE